ncbi:MAG TPA: sigma-70 family RNA polymerase sigma factor [Paludibacteraceae bacterium]|nr:sigma-70 family RNA polymerase sigma factor [Paludibacteraceae bacterium]HOU68987.1 sigma-70 family RNA polymerase sigma factor [Paludibacteraceae bacterium]HPH63879.1 sigma-70 family RNA polymerase sigma factor [Paludibacteraceae bacterium]HQF50792.1 sigma-70 family RNA polymerase sigma factor [Paludibacteraceae bacterium]HQJ90474.1 sigma-70 family RNA polymerase sigma factor [Paludibacteraceae bacterium]
MEALETLTDEELVELYANENNDAFDILLLRHKSKVFSYIYLSVKDRDLANDLFQETFIKAITTIKQGRYTEKGKFVSWITRIAHNLIIDYFRRERNEHTVSNDDSDVDLFNDIKLYNDSIEDNMVKEQVFADIINLVEHLPENQKEVLKMRFFEDLSFKEIADNTGVSINTALGRMRYAILNMRKMAEENQISLEY